MELHEMRNHVEQRIHRQGTAATKAIAPLFTAIIDKLASMETEDRTTATIAVTIGEASSVGTNLTSNSFKVTNSQEEIDQIIDSANTNHDLSHVAVLDSNMAIIFNFLNYSENELIASAAVDGGEYHLYLHKDGDSYLNWSKISSTISPVAEAEINAYKKLFGASYDFHENKFQVQLGTSLMNISPTDMLFTALEYNKVANLANYTAMWANSKARFIKCHDWYFSNVAMTSAFLEAATEVIDLNADSTTGELKVGDCTKMFSGCSKLQQVVGIISLASSSKLANAFDGCSKLISIKLKGLSQSIDLSSCIQISPESVLYMVQNAVAHSIIVIKLATSVLEKYNGSSDWTAVRSAVESNTNIIITE